jgi:hypothetical protein
MHATTVGVVSVWSGPVVCLVMMNELEPWRQHPLSIHPSFFFLFTEEEEDSISSREEGDLMILHVTIYLFLKKFWGRT